MLTCLLSSCTRDAAPRENAKVVLTSSFCNAPCAQDVSLQVFVLGKGNLLGKGQHMYWGQTGALLLVLGTIGHMSFIHSVRFSFLNKTLTVSIYFIIRIFVRIRGGSVPGIW